MPLLQQNSPTRGWCMPSTGQNPRLTTRNRRNHYRILHVQPDAPLEVIKANYRTLMQKLKLHPDLGGDHWNAACVNAAYAILSDPVRRAAYDRELLASYDIATISRGPLQPTKRSTRGGATTSSNRRNFYRVLQVQADAPIELIEASHRALAAKGATSALPLTEALATLRDPARREAYDRLLGLGRRAGSASGPARDPERAASLHQPAVNRRGAYEPLISTYCLFCKTPHQADRSALEETGCLECASPLFPPRGDLVDQIRRSCGRSPQDEEIGYYTFWPGARQSGRLLDLSPTGLRFFMAMACQVGDIIKIDTRRLQAVGTIAHQDASRRGAVAGVKFHTVGFLTPRGSFVSARA